MRIPIAIRGGFDKKRLPSRSESSENIHPNKLGFVEMFNGMGKLQCERRGRRLGAPL